jgi:PAS domain S-box-containing protein
MPDDIRVLHVDDEPGLVELAKEYVQREESSIVVETSTSPVDAFDRVVDDDASFDAVVSDYQMPEMDGLEFLQRLREAGSEIPFVVFTGRGREEVAIRALNLGANRYLQKGGDPASQYGLLARAIVQEVESHRASRAVERREKHFRTTLDSIGDAVLTTDETGRVARMNPVAEELTGWTAEAARGRPASVVFDVEDPETGAPVPCPVERVLDTGETVELADRATLVTRGGDERYVADTAAPIRSDGGETRGVVVVFKDVTDAYERRRRRQRQRDAVVDVATAPAVVEGRFDAAARLATETVAETLPAERVSVWLLGDEDRELRCVDLYRRSADEHERGTVLHADRYPRYFDAVRTNRAVAADDARQDPRTNEFAGHYLEPHGITSMLDATIRRRGDVVGVLCVEHVGDQREWRDDEVSFAAAVADQTLLALLHRDRDEATVSVDAVRRHLDGVRAQLSRAKQSESGALDDLASSLAALEARLDAPQSAAE